jgi:hypothetical protein
VLNRMTSAILLPLRASTDDALSDGSDEAEAVAAEADSDAGAELAALFVSLLPQAASTNTSSNVSASNVPLKFLFAISLSASQFIPS